VGGNIDDIWPWERARQPFCVPKFLLYKQFFLSLFTASPGSIMMWENPSSLTHIFNIPDIKAASWTIFFFLKDALNYLLLVPSGKSSSPFCATKLLFYKQFLLFVRSVTMKHHACDRTQAMTYIQKSRSIWHRKTKYLLLLSWLIQNSSFSTSSWSYLEIWSTAASHAVPENLSFMQVHSILACRVWFAELF